MWLIAAAWVWIAAASLGTAAVAATAAVKPASEPVSELLEKAIYKEESAGDLDAAIQIYQEIIQQAEANRHAVAEAHYRLGMCLIKKGDKEKGQEILTKLVEGYPEEKDLVKKAHEQLQPALNLIPAPWKNGEAFTLSILAPSGSEIGTLSYTARLTEVKGTPAWEISGQQSITVTTFTQSTRVVAERDTFAPITGYTKNTLMGEFDAQYSKGLARLKIKGKQGEQTKEFPLDQVAYDNEQVLFLIRRLPLAENYKTSFPIFPVQGGGVVVECGIEVTGKEKVRVPVGEYDCFAVKLQVRSQGAVVLEHRLWFSNDANRYVVKYDAGAATMELKKVGTAEKENNGGDRKNVEQPSYRDEGLGIIVRTPKDWQGFFGIPMPGDVKVALQLKPPARLNAACYFAVKDRGPEITTVRQALEESVKRSGIVFKSYLIRKDSWKERTVRNLPAASMVADFQGKVMAEFPPQAKPGEPDKAMVEYRVGILGPKYIYVYTLRVEKDAFEKAKPEFDKVVDMFELVPPAK
jgi:hypothetical protein